MVAKIKSGKSLIGALNYNENKVKQGKANLLEVRGYSKDHDQLSFCDKLLRLTDLAARNARTKTNTVHTSLNFDVGEHLEKTKLVDIADSYMGKIGFGDQPYLIYEHFDAGHQHIHIVATNIHPNGDRISLHNIGKEKSEPARIAIEKEFKLVRAQTKSIHQEAIEFTKLKPVTYGTIDTKRAITNIVSVVAKQFRFASLPEYNAILNHFNILADRGSKESVMYAKGGLHYWIIDSRGKKAGVPIKASSIYTKPTLKLLESRFKLNEFLKKPLRLSVKGKIDQALASASSQSRFIELMKEQQVDVLFRTNAEGRTYGLTFADHADRVVFNGSDLGKEYSAVEVLKVLSSRLTGAEQQQSFDSGVYNNSGLLGILFSPEQEEAVPAQLKQKLKKKKRRNLNL